MSGIRKTGFLNHLCVVAAILNTPTVLAVDELTLQEAEQLALAYDPVSLALDARKQAYSEKAVADGQLPDPALKFGTMNLPVDSFKFNGEPMTQVQIGLMQAVPAGDTLRFRREYTEALSTAESARKDERRLSVLREVRLLYLDIYVQLQIRGILQNNRELFAELLDTIQRQYAAGRNNQHDVMRAQLELSLVDDRILDVQREEDASRAALSRYLPQGQASRPVPGTLPDLSPILDQGAIQAGLVNHPLVLIEDAAVDASRRKISEIEQKYKPGFTVDVTYGKRFGPDDPGVNRPDMLSAMVTVDLPLFTDKRQDRELAAVRKFSQASQFSRTDRLYELNSMLLREYANRDRLLERLGLYEQRAVSDARLNSESTLKAYQTDVTDFTTLVRARLIELDTKIDMLRVRVELSRVNARILYLAGE